MAFKSILDREFKYRNAVSTDVRKTFERIRRELQAAQPAAAEKQTAPKLIKIAAAR